MMNIYERKEIQGTKQERLAALDKATQRLLPDDVLKYVISGYMDDTELVVVERLETFKMQPRNTFEETHRCCHYYCGSHRGECMFWCGQACNQFALIPCVLTGFGALIGGGGCMSGFDCATNNKWRVHDRCCNGPNSIIEQKCSTSHWDCAKTDYRLKRSICAECGARCYDHTIGFFDGGDRQERLPLNGPEAMWME